MIKRSSNPFLSKSQTFLSPSQKTAAGCADEEGLETQEEAQREKCGEDSGFDLCLNC